MKANHINQETRDRAEQRRKSKIGSAFMKLREIIKSDNTTIESSIGPKSSPVANVLYDPKSGMATATPPIMHKTVIPRMTLDRDGSVNRDE
jgi:hypothetical protein